MDLSRYAVLQTSTGGRLDQEEYQLEVKWSRCVNGKLTTQSRSVAFSTTDLIKPFIVCTVPEDDGAFQVYKPQEFLKTLQEPWSATALTDLSSCAQSSLNGSGVNFSKSSSLPPRLEYNHHSTTTSCSDALSARASPVQVATIECNSPQTITPEDEDVHEAESEAPARAESEATESIQRSPSAARPDAEPSAQARSCIMHFLDGVIFAVKNPKAFSAISNCLDVEGYSKNLMSVWNDCAARKMDAAETWDATSAFLLARTNELRFSESVEFLFGGCLVGYQSQVQLVIKGKQLTSSRAMLRLLSTISELIPHFGITALLPFTMYCLSGYRFTRLGKINNREWPKFRVHLLRHFHTVLPIITYKLRKSPLRSRPVSTVNPVAFCHRFQQNCGDTVTYDGVCDVLGEGWKQFDCSIVRRMTWEDLLDGVNTQDGNGVSPPTECIASKLDELSEVIGDAEKQTTEAQSNGQVLLNETMDSGYNSELATGNTTQNATYTPTQAQTMSVEGEAIDVLLGLRNHHGSIADGQQTYLAGEAPIRRTRLPSHAQVTRNSESGGPIFTNGRTTDTQPDFSEHHQSSNGVLQRTETHELTDEHIYEDQGRSKRQRTVPPDQTIEAAFASDTLRNPLCSTQDSGYVTLVSQERETATGQEWSSQERHLTADEVSTVDDHIMGNQFGSNDVDPDFCEQTQSRPGTERQRTIAPDEGPNPQGFTSQPDADFFPTANATSIPDTFAMDEALLATNNINISDGVLQEWVTSLSDKDFDQWLGD